LIPVNLLSLMAARATNRDITPITTRTTTSKINQFVGLAMRNLLFDWLRVYRRADRARYRERRSDEHGLVYFIGGAILRDLFEIENLSHQQTDIGDHHLMERLQSAG
jgi:hypothetical protein